MQNLRKLGHGAWVMPLRTPTLPPATTTNVAVFGHDRLLVVEPATPHAEEQARLRESLRALTAEGRRVVAVAITHHHADHVGDARGLADDLDAPLHAHPETAARVDFAVDEAIGDGWSIDLGGGEVVDGVFTPGHAPGHMVFIAREAGIAHAGDMVAGEGTILIDPNDAGDMNEYLSSLKRLQNLAAGVDPQNLRLIPAHGPVIDDGAARFEHYIHHRMERERKLMAALDSGTVDFRAALERTYDDVPESLYFLARLSLEAHLRKLEGEGRVKRHGERITATGA